MVAKLSRHHVLSPNEQEQLDRTLIKEILKEHNLKENVDIIYRLAVECMQSSDSDHVDDCLRAALGQFNDQKKVNDESHVHSRKDHFSFPLDTD